MPACSIIIPVEGGGRLPASALDAFLPEAPAGPPREVILVMAPDAAAPARARHRGLRLRRIAWPRPGSVASAYNAGARAANGAMLVMLTPAWRPLPGLVEACRRFHAAQPAEADVLAFTGALPPSLSDDALIWWMAGQALGGFTVPPPGIHTWRALRLDAWSAKRDLLRRRPMPTDTRDEWLLKARWAARAPIRVFVDEAALIAPAAPARLATLLRDEYLAAYARHEAMRASSQTFAESAIDDRFRRPEAYLLSNPDRDELARVIGATASAVRGRNPRFAIGDEAERFALLGKLYLVAVSHARSAGWADAAAKRRPGPARALRGLAPE